MGAPSTETTFHYEQVRVLITWTVAVDTLVLGVALELVLMGKPAQALQVGSVLLPCFSLIGWFVVSSMADVVVSEGSLSRRLWGRTLREISWGNIKMIRVFKMYHRGYGRTVRVFQVFPIRPSGLRFLPSGKIVFDEPGDLSSLIEHMNRRIAARGIPVEVLVGASRSDPASWSTRNRIDPTP